MNPNIKFEKMNNILLCEYKPVLMYEITYPIIGGFIVKSVEERINSYYERRTHELLKSLRTYLYSNAVIQYRKCLSDGFPFRIYEYSCISECSYSDEKTICIKQRISNIKNGRDHHALKTQVWSVANGTKQNISHYVNVNNKHDIVSGIVNEIKDSLKSEENRYFKNAPSLAMKLFDKNNYYIFSRDELAVFYPEATLCPSCFGIPEFVRNYQ